MPRRGLLDTAWAYRRRLLAAAVASLALHLVLARGLAVAGRTAKLRPVSAGGRRERERTDDDRETGTGMGRSHRKSLGGEP